MECNGKVTTTGYGVGLDDEEQTFNGIREMIKSIGFEKVDESFSNPTFKLKYKK